MISHQQTLLLFDFSPHEHAYHGNDHKASAEHPVHQVVISPFFNDLLVSLLKLVFDVLSKVHL
jgi:hypothetical protein